MFPAPPLSGALLPSVSKILVGAWGDVRKGRDASTGIGQQRRGRAQVEKQHDRRVSQRAVIHGGRGGGRHGGDAVRCGQGAPPSARVSRGRRSSLPRSAARGGRHGRRAQNRAAARRARAVARAQRHAAAGHPHHGRVFHAVRGAARKHGGAFCGHVADDDGAGGGCVGALRDGDGGQSAGAGTHQFAGRRWRRQRHGGVGAPAGAAAQWNLRMVARIGSNSPS
ncbi:Mitochondrial substrate carrier family protein [Gracilaria domingensis]|nr:Mitochondrial substrate carrier family protein [Gracilaria domingensis]